MILFVSGTCRCPPTRKRRNKMDAHVDEYYAYWEAVEAEEANDQMRAAEGAWEDAGCYS
jgi:hypothetical protein